MLPSFSFTRSQSIEYIQGEKFYFFLKTYILREVRHVHTHSRHVLFTYVSEECAVVGGAGCSSKKSSRVLLQYMRELRVHLQTYIFGFKKRTLLLLYNSR